MKSENKWWKRSLATAGYLALGVSGWLSYTIANKVPNVNDVQHGYAIPNKLEIKVKDLDRDGRKETLMKYDGKDYLIFIDENGELRVQIYQDK